jgi:hypothetical protein
MADFNGDGYDDLALYFADGRVQVATASDVNDPAQSPHLNFGPPSALDTLADLTVGDFNGDGRPEIAGLVQLSSGVITLVIYTVDAKTLTVSKAAQITLQKPQKSLLAAVSITRGRFTPAGGAPPRVMNLSAVPTGHKATYDQEDSTNKESGSTNTTSWSWGSKESLGSSYTFGDPDLGDSLKISDTVKAAQNLKGAAEHDHGTSQRKTFNLSATTGFGDEVSYLDPEFNIWVYPVIGKIVCPAAKPSCQDSEKVPLTIQFSAPNGDALTDATQGQALQWYQPP